MMGEREVKSKNKKPIIIGVFFFKFNHFNVNVLKSYDEIICSLVSEKKFYLTTPPTWKLSVC